MTENEAKRPKVAIVGGGRNAGRTIQAQVELLARIDELEAYQSIGTVEEFKELKEKNEPKKIKGIRHTEAICPSCEIELYETYWAFGGIHYCSNCGQKIDWQ